MQVPPEQPIGPGGYPRPTNYGQPEKFGADLAVGIILIVLNAIGTCFGGLAVLGGGLLAGGAKELAQVKDPNTGQALSTTQAQAAGGMAMIFGILLLIACIVSIVGAVGVIKSAKWGLTTIFVIGILMVLGSVIPFNPIGLVVGLFQAIYGGVRLYGNVGPKAA